MRSKKYQGNTYSSETIDTTRCLPRVASQSLLGDSVPDADSSVRPGSGKGSVDRMNGNAIDGVNQLGIVHVCHAMTAEGERLGDLVLLNVFHAHTAFNTANHEAVVVVEEANAANAEFENAFPRKNGLRKCLKVVTNDLSVFTGNHEFSRDKNYE